MSTRRHGRHGPRDGTLVDTWYYGYEGIQQPEASEDEAEQAAPKVAPIKVKIELRLIKEFEASPTPPQPLAKARFEIRCEAPLIRIRGTDIEAMRCAMWSQLKSHYAVRWEDYLLVRIEKPWSYSGRGDGIELVHRRIERGTAWDGTLLKRTWENSSWVIEPWPGEFRDDNGNVMACIASTEANKQALERFEKMIGKMRGQLADHFRPDRIDVTLANLSGLAGLLGTEAAAQDGEADDSAAPAAAEAGATALHDPADVGVIELAPPEPATADQLGADHAALQP